MRVLVASSSRADIGIVGPVWDAIASSDELDLEVLLTGMHVPDDSAARRRVPPGVPTVTVGADLGGERGAEASRAMADIAAGTSGHLASSPAEVVVVTGDRLDMLPVAVAAVPFNVPIVHVAGGDLTLGAIDDRVRHAMTKLAHVHCVVTLDAAYRVARMGEEPRRIHVTGAPNLDTLAAAPELSADEFAGEVGLASGRGFRLVTVHPETNTGRPIEVAEAVLEALDRVPGPTLITAPNTDPGGAQVRQLVERFVARHEWAVFRDTLGGHLYANALRLAEVMVGNSSSGIVEAELFGLPVLDVGHRQEGRAHGRNVMHAPAATDGVVRALEAIAAADRFPAGSSIYGDGRAAERILAVLTELRSDSELLFKRFYEGTPAFTAPWSRPEAGE